MTVSFAAARQSWKVKATILAIAAALYSSVALYLERTWKDPTPRGRLVVPLHPPFEAEGGHAFLASSMAPAERAALLDLSDDPHIKRGTSPIGVVEEGKPIGPAHSTFCEISKFGNGHFASWNTVGVVFSTSDNSDPNTNGRHYWAVVPTGNSPQGPGTAWPTTVCDQPG
ncbi:hypothetical protein MTX26_15860 [Bradyrhizobium sp. ISRA443]|uniref:hypothetical protein n=1 Tax=unclassified Bradyrhizobium TaxID=2631580 RepID=UPI00247A595D|nr:MULTISPECIES: hypothetical protein [unclassified Bradyrhizobium]WGR91837.1 hypothetical protein MTX20_26435 [Bradyrhizobium sp. ISRA435]WGS02203.1 hypothetical protein MTX23_15870 [Bradyrhizobium sp. ISRA436]WGS09088.1 hypothetical protein MTX18_15860 [Bradyrhizobium sp. ISRA437]WGS15977.1 hypothetical protein MTX26_15860 [Bradyrhizobium sp. ISRA443]